MRPSGTRLFLRVQTFRLEGSVIAASKIQFHPELQNPRLFGRSNLAENR
jgi:hypothetical protein